MILYYIVILSLAFVDHPIFGIGFGGFTVEKAVGAAALVYAIVHLALRRTKPVFVDTWPARAFLAFFLLSLGSYLVYGLRVTTAFNFHLFNFLLLLFMTISVVDSISRLRWALLTALASIAWAALYMLREWQGGVGTYGYSYRPGYVVGDPNYFASSALLCLPLACYFARSMPSRWIRWACGACVVLILAGITVSGSRGGVIGLMVVVLLMIWHSRQRVRAFLLIAALGGFLMVSPVSPLGRLLHPTGSDRGASEARVTLWKAAWRMFLDHPINGVGYGNFAFIAPRYVENDVGNLLVHNQYLEVLSETGLPGLLVYCGMYVASFVSLQRARHTAKRLGSRILMDAALGLQIGLIGYGVSVFFLSAQFLKMFWFMLFVSASMPALLAGAVKIDRARRRLGSDMRSLNEAGHETAGPDLEFQLEV